MKCAWESFIQVIPIWMRSNVDKLGKNAMRELRLRINAPPELVFATQSTYLERSVTKEDLQFCVNTATKYSPWSSETASEGYISIPGGHRIGLCGSVIHNKDKTVFFTITSVCIRISRDFPGIAKAVSHKGSILIVGKPGSGKTTFLRDLAREISLQDNNRVIVVDERHEIFPYTGETSFYETNSRIDVIAGCKKSTGIEMVLRTMTPTVIAVDEITSRSDVDAIIHSNGCGVSLLATAHATGLEDLNARPIYKDLLHNQIFKTIVILHPDMTWHMESVLT